ncbi:MAG: UDP-N-acetylmuramate--L-alanine ligase [Epsilonproteobacteria bacterium]|nr:MAG: UDP-N-acetylmuramate--L-alanine ligase [Campylobacterota bacterium]
MTVDLNKIKEIHFIGVGGIGLSAIARLMKEKSKEISGSDLSPSLVVDKLKKLGVKIYSSQVEKNISDDLDLVIYTTAVPKNNPELKKAKELKIKTITYPEALGIIFNDKFGIAVCGTHGKSTVSAMAGILLEDARLDPSVIVGSLVSQFNNSNLRIGKNKYFVAEACEYERSFLNLYPKIIILNNIELDHTDYYRDLDDMRSVFEEFIGHLPEDGVLICNGDDERVSSIKHQASSKIQNSKFKILSFGLNKTNDVRVCSVDFKSGKTKFKVFYNNKKLGEFILKMPGLFNVYNALGVITLGLVLDIPVEVIKKSLVNFSGIWRRFEIKGEYKNALVVSDYAHHPTAVKATIEAVREFYPNRRIFAVFQPHQHSRTKKLYQDFLKSFNGADILILSEIFDVTGREKKKDQSVSSLDLVNDIKKKNRWFHSSNNAVEPVSQKGSTGLKPLWNQHIINANSIFYAKNLKETEELINTNIESGDILLIMGAGDIYKIADNLVK